MKDFKVLQSKSVLAAMVLLLGLVLGVMGAQQAAAVDAETDFGEPLVIAAQQGAPQAVVPNLIGKNKSETQKALAKAGLTLGEVKFTTTVKGKPGTVVKQKPKPKTKVDKGSAVDVMVLKFTVKISPKIVQKGEKVFMEFPERVKDVTISDEQGNKLQQFKQGKRFDVTESAVATKAGCIKVDWEFSPPEKLYWGPQPSGSDLIDFEIDPGLLAPRRVDVTQVEPALALTRDDTTIDNGEPANNDLNGAVQISDNGQYSGTVGGSDPKDWVKIILGPHQPGTLVTAAVQSGSVELTLEGSFVDDVEAFWGAAVPGEICYIEIEPTAGETTYTISIATRPVYDAHEPNDDFQSATPITLGSSIFGCLCSFWDSGGPFQTGHDFYMIQLPSPQKIRIKLSSVGLRYSNAKLTLYRPDSASTPFESITGTNNEAELVVDFPSLFSQSEWQSQGYHNGSWRIDVYTDMPILPCGEGVPPPLSFRPYRLEVDEIP